MTTLMPLQGFFKPDVFERMVQVYGKDQRKFWKEATSGKFTSPDDPIADPSTFGRADRRADFYISDNPRFDGRLSDVPDAGFNTPVVVGNRLLYVLESRDARYRLQLPTADTLRGAP